MDKISVVVSGTGFMGREVLAAISREEDLEPVGVVEKFSTEGFVSLSTGAAIPLSNDPAEFIARLKPRVIIDFTNAQWTPDVAKAALENGASMVIGTTGLSRVLHQRVRCRLQRKAARCFHRAQLRDRRGCDDPPGESSVTLL